MTPSCSGVRAVFFDVDFTLIYPGPTFQGEGYARFCAAESVDVDAARFEEAVAAASFILDEVEEPVYDAGLFIHYTATIIEQMGGRGAERRPRGRDASTSSGRQTTTSRCTTMCAGACRSWRLRGLTLGVISNSHRSLDAFREHFKL